MTDSTIRYEIAPTGDGSAIVMDRATGLPIKTTSGQLYVAPLENAQWTADTMNRTNQVASESAPIAPEEETEPASARNSMDIAQAQRQRIKAAQERRETFDVPALAGLADWELELLSFPTAPDERSPETIRAEQAEARLIETEIQLERAEAKIARLTERMESRHAAAMRYAARVGALRADLASVRARLVGTIDGMLPTLRRNPTYGASEDGYARALNLIDESLSETREFVSKRLDETDY